jgi:hypothetical protein
VWARDPQGNQSQAVLELASIGAERSVEGGCGCGASGGGPATGSILLLLAAVFGLRRRFAVAALVALTAVGCHAGADKACHKDGDCLCDAGKVPVCGDDQCRCLESVPLGNIGQHSDAAIAPDGTAWVSAYNSEYGDLMVAQWPGIGRIDASAWQFVDGLPAEAAGLSRPGLVRAGTAAPGPNVGLYTSIAVGTDGEPVVAYFDASAGQLKLAARRAGAWQLQVVDPGDPARGVRVGRYASLSLDRQGRPGIAYLASQQTGTTVSTEVRFAQARSATPHGSNDWEVHPVERRSATADAFDAIDIPNGVGLFVDLARLPDDRPVMVYYNRIEGDLVLRTAEESGNWTRTVLDGKPLDVGWFPSVAVENMGQGAVLHVAYMNMTNRNLRYVNPGTAGPVVVDDGYRERASVTGGPPIPEFHYVGAEAKVVLTPAGLMIAYQDATAHELRLARRIAGGQWKHGAIAGNQIPFAGGYGFYTSAAVRGDLLLLSSYVINQPARDAWVEIFRISVAPGD